MRPRKNIGNWTVFTAYTTESTIRQYHLLRIRWPLDRPIEEPALIDQLIITRITDNRFLRMLDRSNNESRVNMMAVERAQPYRSMLSIFVYSSSFEIRNIRIWKRVRNWFNSVSWSSIRPCCTHARESIRLSVIRAILMAEERASRFRNWEEDSRE